MSELLPLGLGIKAGLKRTTGNMQVYADGTSGSDSNDGLTAMTPKKTLQAVYNLIPYYVDHSCTINLSGTFNDPSDGVATLEKHVVQFSSLTPTKGYLLVDGGSSVTVVNDNGGSNFTPDIYSISSIGLTTAGWTVDAYMGYILEIVSGTCAGQSRMIQGNTATTITPVRNFSTPTDATSVFRIVRPATTIGNNASPGFRNMGAGSMNIQRLFVASGAGGQILIQNSPGYVLFSHIVSLSAAVPAAFYAYESANVQFLASIRNPANWLLQSLATNSQAGVSAIGAAFSFTGFFGFYAIDCLTLRCAASVLKAFAPFKSNNVTIGSGSRIEVMLNMGCKFNSVSPIGITTTTGYATTKFGGISTLPAIQVFDGTLGIGEKVEFLASKVAIDLNTSFARLEGCYGAAQTDFGLLARSGSHVNIRPALKTGTNTTFSITGSIVTLTGSGTFAAADVGRTIFVAGATTPGNNGHFVILSVPASNQVTYTNASGASEAGAGNYYVGYPSITGGIGDISVDTTTEETDWDTVCVTGTALVDSTKQLVTVQKLNPLGWPL